jgi:putative peptidoglycan binding protein
MRVVRTTRKFRFAGACAVMLTCALAAAVVGQDSTTADKKAAPPKKTASSAHETPTGTESAKNTSSKNSSGKHTSHKKKKSARARGQQKIDSERAQEIQKALIREHYLSGSATGVWNQACEEAMRRYQADNGWQSKTVPDSRALIKLGLGPSKDHLLNPESAMTTVPDPPKAEPVAPISHPGPAVANPGPTASPSSSPATSDSSNPQ